MGELIAGVAYVCRRVDRSINRWVADTPAPRRQATLGAGIVVWLAACTWREHVRLAAAIGADRTVDRELIDA